MVLEKLSGPRNEYLEAPVRNVAQKASGGVSYIVLVPAGPLVTVHQCDYAPGTGHLTGGFDRHHMAMLGVGPPGVSPIGGVAGQRNFIFPVAAKCSQLFNDSRFSFKYILRLPVGNFALYCCMPSA